MVFGTGCGPGRAHIHVVDSDPGLGLETPSVRAKALAFPQQHWPSIRTGRAVREVLLPDQHAQEAKKGWESPHRLSGAPRSVFVYNATEAPPRKDS